jgi:hypothetical protein
VRKILEKYNSNPLVTIIPLTKMTAMRILRHLATLALIASMNMIWTTATWAQNTYTLSVDSVVGIPDTIYDGQTITFTMMFSNQSNLGFQGDVETVLYFPIAQDTITADSSVMNADFVAAQAQESVFASHFFTSNDNYLAIGDNVVVVWPRITFGPTGPPQEVLNAKTINFYLAPPLSASGQFRDMPESLGLFPNPTEGDVRLLVPKGDRMVQVAVTDISGRQLIHTIESEHTISTKDLPSGLYSVSAIGASGKVYRGRLVVR